MPPNLNELNTILTHDLGKKYDPQKALEFLMLLEKKYEKKPEAKNLEKLLENPPKEDTTLYVIYKTPFVLGEIVLAGKDTQKQFPLCRFHPVHFKKTYLQKIDPEETDPKHEFLCSKMVKAHFEDLDAGDQVPTPLGCSPQTFRSELIEGKTLGTLSPLTPHLESQEITTQITEYKKQGQSILPLWEGLETLNKTTNQLHSGGMLHKDLHRENMMLVPTETGFEGRIIDFETVEEDERFQTREWEAVCLEDKTHLYKETALITLCATQKDLEVLKTNPFFREIKQFADRNRAYLSVKQQLKSNPEITIN
jgi:hypothetical protein